jgi:hypothetical protein
MAQATLKSAELIANPRHIGMSGMVPCSGSEDPRLMYCEDPKMESNPTIERLDAGSMFIREHMQRHGHPAARTAHEEYREPSSGGSSIEDGQNGSGLPSNSAGPVRFFICSSSIPMARVAMARSKLGGCPSKAESETRANPVL